MANYFHENFIRPLVIEYQSADEQRRKELLSLMWPQTIQLINGIIFTHSFHRWDNIEDLQSQAMEAIIKSLDSFNPDYITSKGKRVTIFNYFSLTAKRACKYYTIKNKQHRGNVHIDKYENAEDYWLQTKDENINIDLDSISQSMRKAQDNMSIKDEHKKVGDVLIEYLKERQTYNKRDFFRWAQFKGYSPNLIRIFFSELKKQKSIFYEWQ